MRLNVRVDHSPGNNIYTLNNASLQRARLRLRNCWSRYQAKNKRQAVDDFLSRKRYGGYLSPWQFRSLQLFHFVVLLLLVIVESVCIRIFSTNIGVFQCLQSLGCEQCLWGQSYYLCISSDNMHVVASHLFEGAFRI